MTCPKCGAQNAEDLIQCETCGELLLDVFGQTNVAAEQKTDPPQASKTAKTPVEAPTEMVTLHGTSPSVGAASSASSQTGSSRTRELVPLTLFANRYQILEVIGEGGMGKVYKALDKEIDKLIALKIVRGEKGEDQEAVQRFKQELLLSRKVTHRNVVRIHDLGEAEGVKYFTMEYIEGQSLKQVIRAGGKIPTDEAIAISKQVLAALEEAHRQGVIHRDMKPQNIMIDTQGTAFVMDFGIARSQDTTGVTATGAVVGTPDYMSPEQVKGERADPQSDIFSFGVILYEMLTGELPYQAESAVSKVIMRLTQKPRAPREINGEIPKFLEAVVLKSMDLDHAVRYRSASEILQDFDRGTVDRSIVLKTQRVVRRNKGIFATAAVATVAVAAAAYLVVRPSSENTTVNAPTPGLVRLAVLPLTNATGAQDFDWMRTGIPEMLVTDLGQSQFIRPLSGQRVFNVLEELGALKETILTEAIVDSLLKRAPAESALSGQFVEAGGRIRFDLTLRKAGAGVTIPLRVELPSADVFGVVDQITRQVKGLLDLTPEQLKGDTDRPIAQVSSASVEAVRAYQAGLAQLQGGAGLAAIPLLKDATEKDPEFAIALAKLAEAYFAAGQTHEAEATVDRAVQLAEQPDKNLPLATRYQIHAAEALIKEDTQKAVDSYGELAKLYPDDPDIRLTLAQAFERLGRLPEAVEGYKHVVAVAPGYGAALQGLGRVQVMSGQSVQAIVYFEGLVQSGQYDGDLESLGMIHSIIGVAAIQTGDFPKAVRNLDRSLDLRQKTSDKRGQAVVYQNLAKVYDRQGEFRRAMEMFKRALDINRSMGNQQQISNVLNDRAISYREAGQPRRALEDFKESLRIEMERENFVNMANRLDHIAYTYLSNGQYDEALVYLEQAKANVEKTGEKREKAINLEYFGRVRRAQGLFKDALASALEARALYEEIDYEAGLLDAHKLLAEIYEDQGRYANSVESLTQSLRLAEKLHVEHDILEAKAPLGGLYVTLGRLDEAQKLLDEAARSHGHDAGSILLSQAQLAHVRGRREEAVGLFQKASAAARRVGKKEPAVAADVELARVYVEQGKLAEAGALVARAREEAMRARLKPVEAEACLAQAELHLARRNPEAARKAALEAISIADKYDGLPVAYRAYAVMASALERLGRKAEALDAYASAAQRFERIRAGLKAEDVPSFTARADIQAFIQRTTKALENGGRAGDAEPLKKWVRA